MGVLRLNMPNLTITMSPEESKKIVKGYLSTGTGLAGFTGKFYLTIQEQRATCNLNSCPEHGGKTSKLFFYKTSRTLIPNMTKITSSK